MHKQLEPLLAKARSFVATLAPLETRLVAEGPAAIASDLKTIRQQSRELGLWTPQLPQDLGGRDLELADFALLSEVLGRSPLGHYACNCQAPDIGNMELLLEFGSPAQKESYLQPLIDGEVRSCFAMTEPHNAGSNPILLDTTAHIDGDGIVINGHKWFTSSADGAAFAIVMAQTDPEAAIAHKRYSMILVPTDTSGYTLVRNIPIMGDLGSGYFSHGEVRFESCRVPKSNLIGKRGDGFALAQSRLGPGRIHHCMRWLGIAQRALEMACEFAQNRRISDDAMLSERQSVRHAIADSHTEIHAARLMVLDAARAVSQQGTGAARLSISMIKVYVAGMLQRVLDRAIQIHGGLGVSDDTLLSFWFRHERAARIYDGPDEVHRDLIARLTLRAFNGTPNERH